MSRRGEWAVAAAGIVGGLIFFLSLPVLWPLADLDLVAPAREIREQARTFLVDDRGFDLTGYRSARTLTVNGPALDYVERSFGRERTQRWIADGLPLTYYAVYFKKRGEPITYTVRLHPEAGVLGWNKTVPEDHPGAHLDVDEARRLALAALTDGLRLAAGEFDEQSVATSEQPERRTHAFVYERALSGRPELRERVSITVAGDEIAHGNRWVRIPDSATRQARAAEAPGIALETIGFVLLAVGAIAAFFIFLRRLQDGSVALGRAAIWPAAVLVCLVGTSILETPRLFRQWDPLWPQWISTLRYLAFSTVQQIALLVVLLAVVAAGDALDRDRGGARGASLWRLAGGRLFDPSVTRASGRGFLVGLLCGGVMALAVLGLSAFAGASTGIQPRGFFFYTLNSSAPALTSLLFFFGIALVEELGYRFFAGSWLLALFGRKWIAIVVPGIVYGLSHTRLEFLPPVEPVWGRALVLTLVGCVWGWAFFRYDALTVVLSHFTADLFIFNWPRLASERPVVVAVSLLTICVPLLPFVCGSLRGITRGRRPAT